MAETKVTPNEIDYNSLQLAAENGWNRYINPINGKIRYWREGTVTGAATPSGGFGYLSTGINFPANVRVVSATWFVNDQAISIQPSTYANATIQAVFQSHYSSATPIGRYHYELEQV